MNMILEEKYQERFLSRLCALDDEDGGHWTFQGGRTNGGYPCFWAGKERGMVSAHRLSYEVFVAPVAKGLDVDHLCRTRWCCNPDHLEPTTRSENLRRGRGPQASRERAALITRCPWNHEYTPENTGWQGNSRYCRTCHRAATARSEYVGRRDY